MSHFLQFIIDHGAELEGWGYLILSAVLITAPPELPKSLNALYVWTIDAAHQFLNMKRPTQPANAPDTKG